MTNPTTPRCVLCGRPEDEAPPSFSWYLSSVGESRCPECGAPQGADLVDRAIAAEARAIAAEAENSRLRRAAAEVLAWRLTDTTALLTNPPQNAALFHAQRLLREAMGD